MLILSHCSSTGVYHRVKRGQTLYRIALTYRVPLDDIVDANDIEDPFRIKVGQEIFIPGAERVLDVPVVRPTRQGNVKNIFIRPVKGTVTGAFWEKRSGHRHKGVDISAPYGTPVKAAGSGEVVYAGSGMRGYGKTVIIDHQNGYFTLYSHLSRILVKTGEIVSRGDLIGRVGRSGRTTGSHLHFEVRKENRVVNPLYYFIP